MAKYIGAIDQGTTSTRFILFDEHGAIATLARREHAQIYPHPGWVEHDAAEIWGNTQIVMLGLRNRSRAYRLEQRHVEARALGA